MSSSGSASASSGFVLQWRKFAFFDKTLVGDPANQSTPHKDIQVKDFKKRFDSSWISILLEFSLFFIVLSGAESWYHCMHEWPRADCVRRLGDFLDDFFFLFSLRKGRNWNGSSSFQNEGSPWPFLRDFDLNFIEFWNLFYIWNFDFSNFDFQIFDFQIFDFWNLKDSSGNVHLADRSFNLVSFQAYEVYVSHLRQMKQRDILITIGVLLPFSFLFFSFSLLHFF